MKKVPKEVRIQLEVDRMMGGGGGGGEGVGEKRPLFCSPFPLALTPPCTFCKSKMASKHNHNQFTALICQKKKTLGQSVKKAAKATVHVTQN